MSDSRLPAPMASPRLKSIASPNAKAHVYPVFPLEIFEKIAIPLFALITPENHGDPSIISSKPLWRDIAGFMAASPQLHAMGYVRWVRVLKILGPEDWERAIELSDLVLELVCLDGAFARKTSKSILTRFPHLRAVDIDSHNDVVRLESGQYAYRDLFKVLPSTLLRLAITRAHGPDLKIIEAVRKHCPNMRVLRFGRCTMFNSVPACEFWTGFPLDHDAYIAANGTDEYAQSVARELELLKNLESLRLGVYFMPSNIVLAHRAYHKQGEAAPEQLTWQQAISHLDGIPIPEPPAQLDSSRLLKLYHQPSDPEFGPESCTFCHDSFQQSKEAERRANRVMKELLPSLQYAEWMDWFSPSHLGISKHVLDTTPAQDPTAAET